MLLLDTSQHPVEDRSEVLHGGLAGLVGVNLDPVEGDALMKVRFRAWDLGDGCDLLCAESSGFHLTRQRSPGEPPVMGFGLMPKGKARFAQHDQRNVIPEGGMFIAEMTEEFTCDLAKNGEATDLLVPLEVLDLPLRNVRTAAQSLPLSPIYGLACQHIQAIVEYTKKFDAPHPSAQQAALHVLRALIKSFDLSPSMPTEFGTTSATAQPPSVTRRSSSVRPGPPSRARCRVPPGRRRSG